jgi:hypothetical protein
MNKLVRILFLLFMQSKRFHSRMRQNGMKLGGDLKAELKKSYKFYRQIS